MERIIKVDKEGRDRYKNYLITKVDNDHINFGDEVVFVENKPTIRYSKMNFSNNEWNLFIPCHRLLGDFFYKILDKVKIVSKIVFAEWNAVKYTSDLYGIGSSSLGINFDIDLDTYNFIVENYKEEKHLILFKFEKNE